MEEWEIKRREELEKEVPKGSYLHIKSGRSKMWLGRLGAIEFQIAMEKESKKMFKDIKLV